MSNDIAVIFKDHMHKINMTPYQEKVANQIIKCQTPALGYHTIECSNKKCTNEDLIFNCCKNIYCPKCRSYDQLKWAADRMKEVLPVEYVQFVFPVHTCLRKLIQYNPTRGLNALSTAVKRALNNTFANINNQIGVIAIMHTNTQLLNYAPHIHCLVPKGYLNSNKSKWIQITKSIKSFSDKLSVQFKICFLRELKRINQEQRLYLPQDHFVKNPESIFEYAKNCRFRIQIQDNVKDVHHTIKYLGDKTKKVIIDNRKIVDYKNNVVTVSWSDRKSNTIRIEEIDALLFLKRFMLHILPSRFTRIRYYGFLSNSCKKKSIELCRKLILKANIKTKNIESKVKEYTLNLLDKIMQPSICPVCRKGVMIFDGL